MFNFYDMLGDNTSALMNMLVLFKGAIPVITTDNPPYTQEDFSAIFPVFPIGDGENEIPNEVFNLFLGMANHSIKHERYYSNWKYLMGLYIAHHLTLYLQTQTGDPTAANALKTALPTGLASSKSVDGLSISYDFTWANDGDYAGYGTWKQTAYGQQLITLTKIYGHTGAWING